MFDVKVIIIPILKGGKVRIEITNTLCIKYE